MKMTTNLRIAIISFEHPHAYSYASALQRIPGAELIAAADSDADRLARVRREHSDVAGFYPDYLHMLDHAEMDAVIICSANSSHLPIALECAKRGKHILCEKPLAPTVEDSQKIIDACRAAGVTLMTAFPVRFSPPVHQLRQLVQSGQLGTVLGASTSNHGSMPGSWFVDAAKSGGGAVIDHTVHVVDLLRWVLEDEVESVYAEYATRLHDLKVEDVGQLIMRFRKGTIASLDTSWSRVKSYPIWGDVKMDFKGTDANVSVNCFPQQIHHFDDTAMRHSGYNVAEDLNQLMIEEFVSAVQEKRPALVSGEDGLRAVQVAQAAYEAGRTGQAVRTK
ncbi:MAG: Gfo/Idh/MocA family protein [Candidatus Sumerlaeaceae bacterium]